MNIGFYRYSLLNRGGDRIVIDYANYLIDCGHKVTFFVKEIATLFYIRPEVNIQKISCLGKLSFLLYAVVNKFNADLMVVDIIHLPLFISFRNKVV